MLYDVGEDITHFKLGFGCFEDRKNAQGLWKSRGPERVDRQGLEKRPGLEVPMCYLFLVIATSKTFFA